MRRKFYEVARPLGFPTEAAGPRALRVARGLELLEMHTPAPVVQSFLGLSGQDLLSSMADLGSRTAVRRSRKAHAGEAGTTTLEANAFLALRERNARSVALGVMMCILSPVLLILLSGLTESGKSRLTETSATGLGLMALFLLIAGAVALFVISGIRSARFEYLEKEPIDTLYGVDGMVRERRERFQSAFTVQLTLGIVLCVAAVIPIFVSLIFFGEEELPAIIATCLMLVLIAVGVLLIVHASMIWGSYKMLLEEGDYTPEAKQDRARHGAIGGIYWGLVTAAYLAWSFLTNAWERTWIIWPVAAVAYGAVFGIVKALRRKDG